MRFLEKDKWIIEIEEKNKTITILRNRSRSTYI